MLRAIMLISVVTLLAGSASAQNLVANPGFNYDVNDWTASNSELKLEWYPFDRQQRPTSGSARTVNTSESPFNHVVTQCVDGVSGVEDIDVGAWVYIPSGQAGTGQTRVMMYWYQGEGCTGPVFSGPSTTAVTQTVEWDLLSLSNVKVPAGTQSVWLCLSNQGSEDFEVFFDDAYLQPSPGVPEYEVVVGETEIDSDPLKQLKVHCPEGKKALGAGWAVLGNGGIINDGRATYFQPAYDGSHWMVNAEYYGDEWMIRMRVICARVLE
jgi:hypothetical protein